MELRIAPTTKANWKAALTQLPAAEARIFVYDCKREGKVSGLEAKKNPFRRSTAIDKKSYSNVLEALLLS